MPALVVEDRSSAGHVLRAVEMSDLPAEVTVRDLLEARIRSEVARFNEGDERVFVGLVQPEDAIAHTDGFHLPEHRTLDADQQVGAALEAVARGIVGFELDGTGIESLDHRVDVAGSERLVLHLSRPVVARRPSD